jgi:hypothetical protein
MPDETNGGPPAAASVRVEIDGTARRFGSVEAISLTVYHIPELRPSVRRPSDGEADKIAWTDPASGMACIIRRSVHGPLCGYVAVEAEHPLYGYDADAVGLGGVSYARACEPRRPIAPSVSRKPPTPDAPLAWWFGFECDQRFDDAPGRASRSAEADGRSPPRGEVYDG